MTAPRSIRWSWLSLILVVAGGVLGGVVAAIWQGTTDTERVVVRLEALAGPVRGTREVQDHYIARLEEGAVSPPPVEIPDGVEVVTDALEPWAATFEFTVTSDDLGRSTQVAEDLAAWIVTDSLEQNRRDDTIAIERLQGQLDRERELFAQSEAELAELERSGATGDGINDAVHERTVTRNRVTSFEQQIADTEALRESRGASVLILAGPQSDPPPLRGVIPAGALVGLLLGSAAAVMVRDL